MVIAAVGWAAIAALLLVSGPPRRRLVARPDGRSRWRVRIRLPGLVGATLVALPLPVGLWFGLQGAVLTATTVLIVLATGFLVRQRQRRLGTLAARTEVAQACSTLAAELRTGRVPAAALASAASDWPLLRPAVGLQEIGGDVTETWQVQARAPGCAGLGELARAWRVSMTIGAPLAPALDQVARALAAEESVRRVVNGELAAPRATGQVMAVLPFAGVGIGYLVGGDPVAFLTSGPAGWTCLLVGTGLAAAGVIWIEWLAGRSAERG